MSSGFSTATLKFRSQWDITFKMTHGTWTTERGLTVGERGRLGGGGQKGKQWDNCNRINKKINKVEAE